LTSQAWGLLFFIWQMNNWLLRMMKGIFKNPGVFRYLMMSICHPNLTTFFRSSLNSFKHDLNLLIEKVNLKKKNWKVGNWLKFHWCIYSTM
jgi:hypothetical protein